MSSNPKINIASYRVLNTLACLFEKDMEMNEIVNELEKRLGGSFNNFVVSKYVHTCKCCGIDIQKVDGKYSLVGVPFVEKLSENESYLINDLRTNADDMKTPGASKLINKLIGKLHLPMCKASNGLKSSENFRLIKLFDKACTAQSDVDFIYRNGDVKRCSPVQVKLDDNDNLVFNAVFDDGPKEVNPYDLADVRLTDNKVRKIKVVSSEVIYELKGKLAQRYQLREHEQLIKKKPNGNLVISNKYEDREKLLRRLMRYDSLCRVMKPDNCADCMKNLIKDTLANYS